MRSRISLAALAAALTLTACTPEQLATWTAETGIRLDARTEAELLALPDVPGRLPDGRTLLVDGRVTGPVAPAGSKCPEHYAAALAAGWPASDWERLDHIIWRESRCIPTAHNPRGRDDSYGILQLNMKAHRGWVRPLVGNDFSRLFDPATNLRIGRTLYDMAIEHYGCGWRPWTTRSTRWCG